VEGAERDSYHSYIPGCGLKTWTSRHQWEAAENRHDKAVLRGKAASPSFSLFSLPCLGFKMDCCAAQPFDEAREKLLHISDPTEPRHPLLLIPGTNKVPPCFSLGLPATSTWASNLPATVWEQHQSERPIRD
jgi:hypothetical protein